MNRAWEEKNTTLLLWISDERVGVDVVIRYEDFDKFVTEFNRDTRRSLFTNDGTQIDDPDDPPLAFEVIDFGAYTQDDHFQGMSNCPVRALEFQALKSEVTELLNWADVELADDEWKKGVYQEARTKALKEAVCDSCANPEA